MTNEVKYQCDTCGQIFNTPPRWHTKPDLKKVEYKSLNGVFYQAVQCHGMLKKIE